MCRGRFFSVHALPNAAGNPRLGLSVSKKVGNAVKRNLVRRRLKEIFRSSASELPAGVDIVVSARPSSAEADFDDLSHEFSRALDKLNVRIAESRGGGEAS